MLPLISDWCSGFMLVFGVWIGKGTWSHSEENRNATSKMGYHGTTLALALVWASPNSQELPLILTTYLYCSYYLYLVIHHKSCWQIVIVGTSKSPMISGSQSVDAMRLAPMDMGNLSRHVLSENFTCIPYHSMNGIFIMYLHFLELLWHQWVDVYIYIYVTSSMDSVWVSDQPFFIPLTVGT